MKRILLLAALLLLLACGGGGGGVGSATVVGRVLSVQTGGPVSPAATVQVGSGTVKTGADGSFSLAVPGGSTSLTVDAGSFGVWTFDYPAASGTVDVGDLWVGPEKVRLTGRALDAGTAVGIAGATVTFAGRKGTTNSVGTFSLSNVAYSSTNLTAFWGILGTSVHPDYFRAEFRAQPNTAVGGVVTVNDVLMSKTGSITPPPPPHNIWGTVSPAADAVGTVATLKLLGTPVRIYTVGSDSNYYFWAVPGTYTAEFVSGTKTATATIVLPSASEVVRQDVTLS